jgi:hypothetical protein
MNDRTPPAPPLPSDEGTAVEPFAAPYPLLTASSIALGLVASALGAIATAGHLFPSAGISTSSVAVIGLVLAGAGLAIAIAKNRHAIGWPIVGAVVSLFPLVLSATAGPYRLPGPTGNPDSSSASRGMTTQASATAPAARSDMAWTPIDRPAAMDGVEVRIESARIGKVQVAALLKDDAPTQTVSDYFSVAIVVKNTRAAGDIHYRSWAGVGSASNQSVAVLRDDQGKGRIRCDFAMLDPVGRTREALLSPGETASDLLVFELRPGDRSTEHSVGRSGQEPNPSTANFYYLELPGANVGGKAVFGFSLSQTLIAEK